MDQHHWDDKPCATHKNHWDAKVWSRVLNIVAPLTL
jgi:hypothetical protein